MRASVEAAWPKLCTQFEGRCDFLYLDTLKLPTTGLGYRVVDLDAMHGLPWLTKAGAVAPAGQVAEEWYRINGRTDLAPKGGFAYQSVATLHLSNETVDSLLLKTTATFWAILKSSLPNLESWPADAQLALMDMAWNLGPNFLGSKWPNFTKTAKAADFTGCAANCLRAVKAPRDYRHRALFNNAAAVVKLGIDPGVLWDTKVPTAPVVPPVVPPPVTPPKEPDVSVAFRGGRTCSCVATSLPLVEKDMIRRGLIKNSIDIFQLGYNGGGVAASAGTHDAGGNTDVAQFSAAQIQVWREWGWTIQHRTVAQGFDGDHGHGWPLGCPHLSAGGRAQADQWSHRQNGLVSRGKVAGKWPIDDWKTAMKKNLAAQKAREEAAAEAARKKELELPTTAEVAKALSTDKNFLAAVANAVINADVIPNTFTSNVDNVNVSTKTALSTLGKRTGDIGAKIDALAAAVAAAFPEQPPAA